MDYKTAKKILKDLDGTGYLPVDVPTGSHLIALQKREQFDHIRQRDNFRCVYCRKKKKLQVAHLKSKKDGGTNDPDNLVSLCKEHHLKFDRGEISVVILKYKAGFDLSK